MILEILGRNGATSGEPAAAAILSTTLIYEKRMAGAVGFEPTIHDTKNRCLTTWPRPTPLDAAI